MGVTSDSPRDHRTITDRYLATAAREVRLGSRLAAVPELAAYYRHFLSRPAFLTRAECVELSVDLNLLFDLVVTLPDRLFGGDLRAFARKVGWTPVQIDAAIPGPGPAVPPPRLGRIDLLRERSGFRVIEMNMGSSMGGLSIGQVNRVALGDPGLAAFAGQVPLGFADPLEALALTFRQALPALAGPGRPVVALTDWPDSFPDTEPHLRLLATLLDPLGLEVLPCHLGQLEVTPEGVLLHGRRVDAVHRTFIIENLLEGSEALALVRPVLDAARRGTVALFTPLETELYGSKGCLAVLSEQTGAMLTPVERALVDRLVPWTRMVDHGPTERDGREIDLVPWVLEHRAELVLKPTMLHGGEGVVTGWRVSDDQWASAVSAAVDLPYVVQQRVETVPERYPVADGTDVTEQMALLWGVFLSERGYSGAIIRGVPDIDVGVLSVGTGARIGCCFTGPGTTAGSGRESVRSWFSGADTDLAALADEGYLPTEVDLAADTVSLARLATEGFGEVWYADTVAARDGADRRTVPVEAFLDQYGQRRPGDRLGVVAHTSRCGSTLLANLLALRPTTMVLKEPDFVTVPARAAATATGAAEARRWTALLAALVNFSCSAAGAAGRGLVVKPTSWTTPVVLAGLGAAEDTSWLFLWRAPEEVIASNLATPPSWGAGTEDARAARSLAGLPNTAAGTAGFYARIWQRAADGFLSAGREVRWRTADYRDLVADGTRGLLPAERWLGLGDGGLPEGFEAESRRYSKAGRAEVFRPATTHQRVPLGPREAGEVAAITGPALAGLRRDGTHRLW